MMCVLLAQDARSDSRRLLVVPAAMRRASLAVFIAQYYLYFTVLTRWSLAYSPAWPLLLLASIGIVMGFALLWSRVGRNDVFSVGFLRLISGARAATALDRTTLRE